MTKEETTAKLAQMGFKATLEDGVIILLLDDEKSVKKANKAIKEVGYKSSWGYRIERREET